MVDEFAVLRVGLQFQVLVRRNDLLIRRRNLKHRFGAVGAFDGEHHHRNTDEQQRQCHDDAYQTVALPSYARAQTACGRGFEFGDFHVNSQTLRAVRVQPDLRLRK